MLLLLPQAALLQPAAAMGKEGHVVELLPEQCDQLQEDQGALKLVSSRLT